MKSLVAVFLSLLMALSFPAELRAQQGGTNANAETEWNAQREALRAFIDSESQALEIEARRLEDLETALGNAERLGDRLRLTLEISWWSGAVAGATLSIRLISSPRFQTIKHRALAIGGIVLGAAIVAGMSSSFYLDITDAEANVLRERIAMIKVHQANRHRAIEDMKRTYGEDLSGFKVQIEGPFEDSPAPAAAH